MKMEQKQQEITLSLPKYGKILENGLKSVTPEFL